MHLPLVSQAPEGVAQFTFSTHLPSFVEQQLSAGQPPNVSVAAHASTDWFVLRFKNVPVAWPLLDCDMKRKIRITARPKIATAIKTTVVIGSPCAFLPQALLSKKGLNKGCCTPHQLT